MKRTIAKAETPEMVLSSWIRKSECSLDETLLPLRNFVRQSDLETKDPVETLNHLKRFPHEEVVREMLGWYRSGDHWKATMALSYFNRSDVLSTIERIIHQTQSGNAEEARAARDRLSKYGEVALRKALRILSGPSLGPVIQEIFSRMEGRVIPKVLKSLRKESFAVRMTIVRALVGRRNRHALPIFLDLVCELKPVSQAWDPEANNIQLWEQYLAEPVLN